MFHAKSFSPLKCTVLWCIVPSWRVSFDEVDAPVSQEEDKKTGIGRLRSAFRLTEMGDLSPEIHSSLHASITGMFFGALYGGFIHSRRAYLEFFERNQATAFSNHFEAKRALQDHVTINFAKGAWAWGWRLAAFTGSFILVSTVISVYRGKSGVFEYSAAGGVAGSIFRANLGLRGMIVGGLLGTALGTIGGGLVFITLKLADVTMDDVRANQYAWRRLRKDARDRSVKRALEEESYEGDLLKMRDTTIAETSNLLPESDSTKNIH